MSKVMLINVLQPEECRIAILENGVLEELYVERTSHESYVNNIYKGRIVNIEPSIQAAFVDFGVGRNGFLHVSDVEPAYYRHLEQRRDGGRDRDRRGGRDRDRRRDEGRARAEREREVARAYGDIEFEEEERLPSYGEAEVEAAHVEERVEPEVAEEPTQAHPWGSWEEADEASAAELEEDITVAEVPPVVEPSAEEHPSPARSEPTAEEEPSSLAASDEVETAGEAPATAEEEPVKETKRKRATRTRK